MTLLYLLPTEYKDGYGPHSHSGHYTEKEDLLPQPGFESLHCTAHSLVTNLTEPPQLHSPCERMYLEEARCTLYARNILNFVVTKYSTISG